MAFRRTLQALFAATLLGGLLLIGTAAGAVDNPDYTAPPPTTAPAPPSSSPTTTVPQSARQVPTKVNVKPVRSTLAITGADVGQSAVLGAGLIVAGGVVLAVRRRRLA